MATTKKFQLSGFAIAVAAVLIVGGVMILPAVLPLREVKSLQSCIAILKQIDGAKNTWALEHHKLSGEVPTDSDLFGMDKYIREKEFCPQGGVYRIGAVQERPRCTIPHHTL